MNKKYVNSIIVLLFGLLFPICTFAESITLKSGQIIEGKIIERTNDYIKIDLDGVILTYYSDEIKNVDTVNENIPETRPSYIEPVELSAKEIFKKCSPAVVYIMTDKMQGSGFIIDKSGIIVTNYHVVNLAEQITVTLKNGEQYTPVSILNYNVLQDLCILKINPQRDLDFIPLGDDTKEEIGEEVLAIGNPQGLDFVISDGIISRKEESLFRKMIQFTCPISSGSSGGPLLNKKGEAIGVNTMVLYSADNVNLAQNLNFAVSINNVKALLASKEEINLAEFLRRVKVNQSLYELSMAPDDKPLDRQITNCYDIQDKDCFMVHFEVLRRLARVIAHDMLYYSQLSLSEARSDKKGLEDVASVAKMSMNIVEKFNGPKAMSVLYNAYFSPSKEWAERVYRDDFAGPYWVLAIFSFYLDNLEDFYKYYDKTKEYLPPDSDASGTVKGLEMMLDEFLKTRKSK